MPWRFTNPSQGALRRTCSFFFTGLGSIPAESHFTRESSVFFATQTVSPFLMRLKFYVVLNVETLYSHLLLAVFNSYSYHSVLFRLLLSRSRFVDDVCPMTPRWYNLISSLRNLLRIYTASNRHVCDLRLDRSCFRKDAEKTSSLFFVHWLGSFSRTGPFLLNLSSFPLLLPHNLPCFSLLPSLLSFLSLPLLWFYL